MNENYKRGIDILRKGFEAFGTEPTEEMLKQAIYETIPMDAVTTEATNWLAKTIVDSNKVLARNCFVIGLCTGLILTLYAAYYMAKDEKSKTE